MIGFSVSLAFYVLLLCFELLTHVQSSHSGEDLVYKPPGPPFPSHAQINLALFFYVFFYIFYQDIFIVSWLKTKKNESL